MLLRWLLQYTSDFWLDSMRYRFTKQHPYIKKSTRKLYVTMQRLKLLLDG